MSLKMVEDLQAFFSALLLFLQLKIHDNKKSYLNQLDMQSKIREMSERNSSLQL